MSTDETMAKIRAARAVATLPKRTARAMDRVLVMLGQIPVDDAKAIARTMRARLNELELTALDPDLLARIGAGWVAAVADVACDHADVAADGVRAHVARVR